MPAFPFKSLTQQLFDLYSGNWQVTVNSPESRKLENCFRPNDKFLTSVGYSADEVACLVSTVGASTIEARFICKPLPDKDASQLYFAVVLYAADRFGNRISAYHVADGLDSPPTPSNEDLHTKRRVVANENQGAVQVPHYIAAGWMCNWKCIGGSDTQEDTKKCNCSAAPSSVTRDMFTTDAGTLQGYSFNVGDLSQSLFNAQPADEVQFYLLLNFCLHAYHPPVHKNYMKYIQALESSEPPTPHYTFGLVIRLYDNNGKPARTATRMTDVEESSEPFYDMSIPRPPY